jgi:hypothetical protein
MSLLKACTCSQHLCAFSSLQMFQARSPASLSSLTAAVTGWRCPGPSAKSVEAPQCSPTELKHGLSEEKAEPAGSRFVLKVWECTQDCIWNRDCRVSSSPCTHNSRFLCNNMWVPFCLRTSFHLIIGWAKNVKRIDQAAQKFCFFLFLMYLRTSFWFRLL